MKAYVCGIRTEWKVRTQPYVAIHEGQSGWLNLRLEPHRIETDLEDFRAWSHEPSIQTFYGLLRWVNGPASTLESSDCAFRPPGAHEYETPYGLCAHGRLMILFRDYPRNCVLEDVKGLAYALASELERIDDGLTEQDAGLDIWGAAAAHLELGHWTSDDEGKLLIFPDEEGVGNHLLLEYQAFGHTAPDAFTTLDRVFKSLLAALQNVGSADN